MEITCGQCGTLFTVDVGIAPGDSLEVVCPGCFQLHKVAAPGERTIAPVMPVSSSDHPRSPLGDGGVLDRLREGFTLKLELRHPSWPEPRKLNPFEVKQLIYQSRFDGQEEFRDRPGRWYPIGEHPDFALVFQLIGQPVKSTLDRAETPQNRFVGWRSEPLPPPPPVAVEVEEEEVAPVEPAPRRVWVFVAAGVALVGLAIVAMLLLS